VVIGIHQLQRNVWVRFLEALVDGGQKRGGKCGRTPNPQGELLFNFQLGKVGNDGSKLLGGRKRIRQEALSRWRQLD